MRNRRPAPPQAVTREKLKERFTDRRRSFPHGRALTLPSANAYGRHTCQPPKVAASATGVAAPSPDPLFIARSMPRFSANLGFLWPDRPLLARVDAAGRAGFKAIELHWPYDVPAEESLIIC